VTEALTLYALLILSMFSIVSPILIVLISVFPAGIIKVQQENEERIRQSEKHLEDSIKNKDDSNKIDAKKVKNTLNDLNKTKRTAEINLTYLNPQKQYVVIFVPLFISFFTILFAFVYSNSGIIFYSLIMISVSSFIYVIFPLRRLVSLLINVAQADYLDKADRQNFLIETLSKASKSSNVPMLKKISVELDGIFVDHYATPIIMESHIEKSINFKVHNEENQMIKYLEFGIELPSDFIISYSDAHTIFSLDSRLKQTVRFKMDRLHSQTVKHFSPIKITPTNSGEYDIRIFAKAENLKDYFSFIQFQVVDAL